MLLNILHFDAGSLLRAMNKKNFFLGGWPIFGHGRDPKNLFTILSQMFHVETCD